MTTLVETQDPRLDRRTRHHEADVVVVGAGVFGCAIAYALANQGRSVLLLERWMHEPDRIVGELLQPGGVQSLKKLGLGHCLDGIDSVPCYGYHVIHQDDEVAIPYPYIDDQGRVLVGAAAAKAETSRDHKKMEPRSRQPEGRCFHHGRFIMNLRKACLGHENITVVETEVTATVRGQNSTQVLGVEARTTDKATGKKQADCFFGQLTIIADGYASKFRKQYIGRTPIVRSKFYALELIDCPLPPQGFGHVVIGEHFLALLYQIGTHETRALIDVPENLPAASPANGGVRGYISNVLLSPANVPNLADGAAIRAAMQTFHWRRKRLTSIVNVLAQALYSLFSGNDWCLRALRKGCFAYFQKGIVDEPCAMLGGLLQSPSTLAYHFFSVAFLALWLHACETIGSPLGLWKLPMVLIECVLVLWKACVVFVPVMWTEMA
ncbi:squalene monooxygenase [Magnaporthiopsis poae ATCC 64411]|uniref:Squalene monooxygenase n=1 Tax=Magnaporthiopsis poae (strain ATCC 64411 / 73-15) TaxID=644358 RepID=A0A0C4DPM1_MAGP6|nr:squalene monooxygenase [Magnaporthiopsis poae ATCC 64411]